MIMLEVAGIRLLSPEDSPVLLLQEQGGTRCLPIWIGSQEAAAIASSLEGEEHERPMTHDLLALTLQKLSPEGRVIIQDIEDGIYHAVLEIGGEVLEARPSDLVAVAVRTGWPITCPTALMDQVGVEVEPVQTDEVEAFRAFLDSVNADDFEDENP